MSDLNIPEFKSSDDFSKWVQSLDEKEIQKWTTDDWLKMYTQIDKYVVSDEFTKEYKSCVPELVQSGKIKNTTTEQLLNGAGYMNCRMRVFTEKNADMFAKMYRNYCFEPEQLEQIRKVATQNGEKLAQEGMTDAAKLTIESSGYEYGSLYERKDEIWRMTQKASDITRKSTSYGTTPETGYVHSVVKIDDSIGASWGSAESHVPGQGTIHMNPTTLGDASINTAFHESGHIYLQSQNYAQLSAAVQKGILPNPELDEKFQGLMIRNGQYYLSPESAKFAVDQGYSALQDVFSKEDWNKMYRQAYNGYHKQPMEKYSNMYGSYAERAYRRSSGQLSERTAIKVADYIEKQQSSDGISQIGRPTNVKYSAEGIELVYKNNGALSVEEFEKGFKGCFAHADESLLKDLNISANKTFNEVKITVPASWEFSSKWQKFTQTPPPLSPLLNQDTVLTEEDRAIAAAQEAKRKAAEQAKKMAERTDAHTFSSNPPKPAAQPLAGVERETLANTQNAEARFNERVAEHTAKTTGNTTAREVTKKTLKNQAKDAGKKVVAVAKKGNTAYDMYFDNIVEKVAKWDAPVWLQKPATAIDKAAGKVIDNKVTRAGGQKLVQAAERFAKTKAGQKISAKLTKAAAKMGGEAAAKSAAKKIPLLCIALGLYFAGERLKNGQYVKACGEVLSGIVGNVPGYGTAASLGLDSAMLADDLKEAGIDMSPAEAAQLLKEGLGGGQIDAEHNPYASESTNVVNPYKKMNEALERSEKAAKSAREVKAAVKGRKKEIQQEASESLKAIYGLAPWHQGR